MITKFEKYNESISSLLVGPTEEEVFKHFKRKTPKKLLIKSCEEGFLNGVKLAFKNGADIHFSNDFPLFLASENGHLDIVKYLVENDSHITDSQLRIAIEKGHLDVVKYLVEHDVDIINNNINNYHYPLIVASQFGHLDVVKYLVEHGADIHVNNGLCLRSASSFRQLDVVKYLVEHGADINQSENNPLYFASSMPRNLDVVKYLVEHGADIHDDNDHALRSASLIGNLDIVKYLVEHGADIHVNNDEPLRNAKEKSKTDVVNYLKSKMGYTNESIKSLLVGPTIEEIKKNMFIYPTNNMTSFIHLVNLCKLTRSEIVDVIFNGGVGTNIRGNVLQHYNIKFDEIFDLCKDLNPHKILRISIFINNIDMTKYALENGSEVNQVDINMSLFYCDNNIVELLKNKKKNI